MAERLRLVIDSAEHAGEASPVSTFERGDVRFAWSEYRFASHGSKKPKGRKRKARGRGLICANDWFHGVVSGS